MSKLFRKLLKRRLSSRARSEMKQYAMAEYKSDWLYAYNHMIDNDGQAPTPNYWSKRV
jgi:hypothetical protein